MKATTTKTICWSVTWTAPGGDKCRCSALTLEAALADAARYVDNYPAKTKFRLASETTIVQTSAPMGRSKLKATALAYAGKTK